MVFSSAELSIFLFFNLALGSCCGRYYLSDGDFFFLQIVAKNRWWGGKKKEERKKISCKYPQKMWFTKETCQPQIKIHYICSKRELKWIASLTASAEKSSHFCTEWVSAEEDSLPTSHPQSVWDRNTVAVVSCFRQLKVTEDKERNKLKRVHHKKRITQP